MSTTNNSGTSGASWWDRHKADAALVSSVVSLVATLIVGIQANGIQGQIRDLSARVDINLVSVTAVREINPAGFIFKIQLSNAGPGVASKVIFGLVSADLQDVPSDQRSQAIAVNGSVVGTVLLPPYEVPTPVEFAGQPAADPAKVVDVWVTYFDSLNSSFREDFPPDSRYRQIKHLPCGSIEECLHLSPTP